jgi:hypothetical protein
MSTRTHRQRLAVAYTFALACTLNLIEVTANPNGAGWTALRVTVSVAFTIALLLWVVDWLRQRLR